MNLSANGGGRAGDTQQLQQHSAQQQQQQQVNTVLQMYIEFKEEEGGIEFRILIQYHISLVWKNK